jgi:hypothetical protein
MLRKDLLGLHSTKRWRTQGAALNVITDETRSAVQVKDEAMRMLCKFLYQIEFAATPVAVDEVLGSSARSRERHHSPHLWKIVNDVIEENQIIVPIFLISKTSTSIFSPDRSCICFVGELGIIRNRNLSWRAITHHQGARSAMRELIASEEFHSEYHTEKLAKQCLANSKREVWP